MAKKQYIDLTPTWERTASNCITILQNPCAGFDATVLAKSELLRMGKLLDKIKSDMQKESEV